MTTRNFKPMQSKPSQIHTFLASYILSKLEIFTCSCIYCNPWQIQTSPNVNIDLSNFQSLGQLESSSQRVRWILQVLTFSTLSLFHS